MIIKYYTEEGSLFIIDGIQDVSVPKKVAWGDYSNESWSIFDFDNQERDPNRKNPSKVITYAKDGPCALKVYGVAYVCTDEGKTIEKVVGL